MKKFSLQMFMAFVVLGTILFLRHKAVYFVFYSLGALFLLGALIPPLAGFLHFIWMKLAFVIEWVITRLVMCIIFYLIFTPLGLIMRLSGRDLLDRKIEKEKTSYWKQKPGVSFDLVRYEKQF